MPATLSSRSLRRKDAGSTLRFIESLHGFVTMYWALNLRTARWRLGLRQSSGAFGWLASLGKAPEDCRTPKPGGASNSSKKVLKVPEGYLPMAVRYSRVLKNNVPSEIAGLAMQVSPNLLVATTENFPSAGTT